MSDKNNNNNQIEDKDNDEVFKVEKDNFFKGKVFWIAMIIYFIILSIICIAYILTLHLTNNLNFFDNTYRLLCDGFFIPGGIGLGIFALVFISQKGAFDMFSYGIKKAVYWTFFRKSRANSLPPTYYDYVQIKNSKRHNSYLFMLYPSLFFLVMAVIFLILFYVKGY